MKLFFLCVLLLGSIPARLAASPQALVVILLPGTSLEDWRNAAAPHLHQLMQAGAVAVMNTRTAHHAGAHEQETGLSALLTLGAGSRAAGAAGMGDGFLPVQAKVPRTEVLAGDLYLRRTSLAPRPGQSVCTNWPAVVRVNADLGYDLRLGSLAETLRAQGTRVVSGGGPDADWIAADPNGAVQRVLTLHAKSGVCVIWDAGPSAAAADAVVGTAKAQIAALRGRLIVISPYANPSAYAQDERLTPVLVWGKDIPAGLLASSSTHQPGLVTNTDFAPAVASYLGIPRTEFLSLPFGFAWSEAASTHAVEQAAHLSRDAVRQARGMALLPYLALGLGLWIGAATIFASRRPLPSVLSLAPLCAVTSALFSVSDAWFWLLPVTLASAALSARYVSQSLAVKCLAGGLTLALTADMVTGNELMRDGLLGYSAIEGARYYGIGNEAMGLLLGAALVTAARLWSGSRSRQVVLIIVMGSLVLLLGLAGAKAGGVLVSLALFATFVFTVSGRRWTRRSAALLAGIVAAGMALAALGDAFLLPSSHSHIGEAVRRITAGGSGEAWDIVRRKLATEGRLAYHSAWAALLWPALLCTGYLWRHSPPHGPAEAALRPAGIVGLASCLLLNDAGVVAAALFAVVLWSDAVTQKGLPALESSSAGRP